MPNMFSQLLSSSKSSLHELFICRPTLKYFFDRYQLAYCPIFGINSGEASQTKTTNH